MRARRKSRSGEMFGRLFPLVIMLLLGWLAWYSIPRISNAIGNFFTYGDISPVLATSSDIALDFHISSSRYNIGESGIMTATLQNASTVTVDLAQVQIALPYNFLDGFILDYPTTPVHSSILKRPLTDTNIYFNGRRLAPGESVVIQVRFIANAPGDYSGLYRILAHMSRDSSLRGRVELSNSHNVIIVP